MGDKFKDTDIKNSTYYFFVNMINMKIFDLNKIKIDEKSIKNFIIYYIRCVTVKDLKT